MIPPAGTRGSAPKQQVISLPRDPGVCLQKQTLQPRRDFAAARPGSFAKKRDFSRTIQPGTCSDYGSCSAFVKNAFYSGQVPLRYFTFLKSLFFWWRATITVL